MKNKLDKHVSRAFESAGVIQNDHIKTVSDLELEIASFNESVRRLKELIEKCKDQLEDCNESLGLLESVRDQLKIERYKELNPGREVYYAE
jgi:chromosome segregation ATPase